MLFNDSRYIPEIHLEWSAIFLKSGTSTGYFSNSAGSSVTSSRSPPLVDPWYIAVSYHVSHWNLSKFRFCHLSCTWGHEDSMRTSLENDVMVCMLIILRYEQTEIRGAVPKGCNSHHVKCAKFEPTHFWTCTVINVILCHWSFLSMFTKYHTSIVGNKNNMQDANEIVNAIIIIIIIFWKCSSMEP